MNRQKRLKFKNEILKLIVQDCENDKDLLFHLLDANNVINEELQRFQPSQNDKNNIYTYYDEELGSYLLKPEYNEYDERDLINVLGQVEDKLRKQE